MKPWFKIGYGVVLLAFTTYIALDTFVLKSSYQTDATQINDSMFTNTTSIETDITTTLLTDADNSTQDTETETTTQVETNVDSVDTTEPYNITMNTYTEYDTEIYVAEIQLSSMEYLKTAFAEDTYGRNVKDTTSDIASQNNAVLAINGDFYGAQESGYVIRNGVVYRATADSSDEICCIYADGSMKIMEAGDYTADELVEQGVWQAFSFGPGLLEDGEIAVTEAEEVGKAMASNPRTAIGVKSDGTYVFVVSDGRTNASEGLSLYQLAEFMESIGCVTAYNLDGGGSSTMYYNGEVVNNPTTDGREIKERSVSDIVYIGE